MTKPSERPDVAVHVEHWLNVQVHVEGIKQVSGHLLSVGLGVDGVFGQEDWIFLGATCSSSRRCGVLLGHADPDSLVARTAFDVGEDVLGTKLSLAHAGAVPVGHGVGEDVCRGVVSGKASLGNAGAFVAEQGSNVSAQILMCWRFPDSGDTGPGASMARGGFLLLVISSGPLAKLKTELQITRHYIHQGNLSGTMLNKSSITILCFPHTLMLIILINILGLVVLRISPSQEKIYSNNPQESFVRY